VQINGDAIIKSMDYCQDVVKRMASNAFKLKSWFLVTFSALFTYFAKSESKVIADLIWTLPMFMFVALDAYYLKQERIFRFIYNDFRDVFNGADVSRQPFDLTPTKSQLDFYSLMNCIFSTSVGGFYFPLLAAFQGLIIFHTTQYPILIGILPALLIVLSLCFYKKTQHAKGK